MTLHHERSLLSTDMLSFGRQDVDSLKLAIPEDFDSKRLEVIGTGPKERLATFINDAVQHGYEIGAVHGPTGVPAHGHVSEKIFLRGVNRFMVDTQTLLHRYPNFEILIHTQEAEHAGVVDAITAAKRQVPFLIENHNSGIREMERVDLIVARLRDRNVPAEPVFDGVHFLRPDDPGDTRQFRDRYSGMIRYLEARSGITPMKRHHFSIGRRDDSYPMELMDDAMLSDYGALVRGTGARVTIEHQPEGVGLLYLSDDQLRKTRERNRPMYARLVKAGIMQV